MTDNTTLQTTTLATPPAGLVVATDSIGGVDYQRTKLVWGVDGIATDASTAAPLPVTLQYTSSNTAPLSVSPSTQWTVSVTPTTQFSVTSSLTSSTAVIGAVMPSTQWTISVTPTTQFTVSVATSTGVIGAVMPSTQWTVTTTPSSAINVNVNSITSSTAPIGSIQQHGAPWSVTLTSGTLALGTVGVTSISSSTTVKGSIMPSSTWDVNAVQSGTWNIGTVTSITNSIGITSSTAVRGAVMPSTQWTVSVTPTTQFSVTTTPSSQITVANSSSTGVIGAVMPSTQWTVTTTPSSKIDVTQVPATTGGLSIVYKSLGITVSPVSATTCQLYGWHIYNSNSSAAYIQLSNATTGTATIGSPTMSIGIPATSGANVHFNSGIAFATALSMVATAGATSTSSCANLVEVNFLYK